ncbi:hypothetical protein MML48_8g00001093 [Holotrichia oblita]|uniref:Uncharacterized protein n=1 Tax=Holotrichia oblita TaxID=644536 RepID=A0ACB9SQ68_HOLOL|nr:hypothetical protein MML48_8g00001093 [Holotrichia oblita]
MKTISFIIIILYVSAEEITVIPEDNHEETPYNIDLKEQVDEENLPSYLSPTINITEAVVVDNVTLANTTEETNVTQKYVSCTPHFGGLEVQLVNDTELIQLLLPDTNVTTKEAQGNCLAVLFYSKYCPFSSMAAPHFNALPRAFPDIKMVAINAMMYHLFNTQNGIVGVPSMLLFHNGRAVAKFNYSEYTLETFSQFLTKYTGINPEEKSFVTSADFSGPVSSVPSKETDIFLGLSWGFIIICGIFYFTKSKWWRWIIETVQSNWRESEAQHEHTD